MFGLFGSSKQKWETTDVSTPTKPHEYEDVRKNVLNTVLEWTNSDDGWTPFSIVDNVTLESKVVDNSGITATRGTLTFEGSDFNRFVDNLFGGVLGELVIYPGSSGAIDNPFLEISAWQHFDEIKPKTGVNFFFNPRPGMEIELG